MALTLTLMAVKAKRPSTARFVVWGRVDQQTCAKSILSAGLELSVVPLSLQGDQLQTPLDGIEERVLQLGPENVLCVVTTTSCFAPRASDDVVGVAKLCDRLGVGHIINNAYGVQSSA